MVRTRSPYWLSGAHLIFLEAKLSIHMPSPSIHMDRCGHGHNHVLPRSSNCASFAPREWRNRPSQDRAAQALCIVLLTATYSTLIWKSEATFSLSAAPNTTEVSSACNAEVTLNRDEKLAMDRAIEAAQLNTWRSSATAQVDGKYRGAGKELSNLVSAYAEGTCSGTVSETDCYMCLLQANSSLKYRCVYQLPDAVHRGYPYSRGARIELVDCTMRVELYAFY